MKSVNCTVHVEVEGLEEINQKVAKLNGLMIAVNELAKSLSESTVTVNLPDVKTPDNE